MFLVAPSFENVEVEVLVLPGFQALCKMWYVKRILEISHVKINGQHKDYNDHCPFIRSES